MDALDVLLDPDDTWLCRHVDPTGTPAASSRLALAHAKDVGRGSRPISPQLSLRCAECGTCWRVWILQRIARPSFDWDEGMWAFPYRRAPLLDIDHVIARVARRIPDVKVFQLGMPHLADDEGLWSFRLPGVGNDIQIESWTGMCPFFVEDSSMTSASQAKTAKSVEEAVGLVIEYLASRREGSRT